MSDAVGVHGVNPQYLVETITRNRIYESRFWKEDCFGLTAELLVDKAMSLDHVGGTFGGNIKPTPFLCLALKMLQIQPEKDIVVEFIKNDDYKYVRALGAFYMRLVGTSLEIYKYLEPLYNDYRKMKRKDKLGDLSIFHMDEFIDELLREERVCDVQLPRLQKRHVLEENEQIEPRISMLEDDMDDLESDDDDEDDMKEDTPPPPPPPQRRPGSPERRRHRSRSPEQTRRSRRSKSRSRSRSPGGGGVGGGASGHRRRRSRSASPKQQQQQQRDGRRERHRSRSRSRSPRRRDHHRSRSRSPRKSRR